MADELKQSQAEQKPAETETKNPPSKLDWKKVRIAAAWFVFIESASIVLWQEAEEFSGPVAIFIHWVSKCGGLFGGAFALHKVSKSKRTVWIPVVIACIVMAIIPFIKNGSQSTAPAFSVEISPVIIQPDKPTNYFLLWNVRGGVKAEGEYLSPINVGWKVQITNLKEAPLKISSYQFECKIPTGNWGIIYLTSQALGCIFTSIKQKTL